MTKTKSPRLHSEFVVRTSAAKMPANCWGKYVHVGVVERWAPGFPPSLSDNSKQVVRAFRGRLFYGKTDRCAAAVVVDRMLDVAARLRRQYAAMLSAGYMKSLADRAPCDEL